MTRASLRRSTSTRSRSARLTSAGLAAGAALALLLTGCGAGQQQAGAAAPVSASPAARTSAAQPADLTAGLLPASAFAAGSQVTRVTPAELAAHADRAVPAGLAAVLRSATVTPDGCATVLRQLQTTAGGGAGPTGVDGFAAQTARAGLAGTAEGLVAGSATDGVLARLGSAAQACATATVSTSAGQGSVVVTPVEAPALGDGSQVVELRLTVPGPGGAPVTVPALAGVVQDGDRLVTLVQAAATGTPDRPGFLALLRTAYDTQATALD